MKDENLYICKVPLELDHVYTQPYKKWTVDETWESWWVVSKNKSESLIILAQNKDQNQRIKITLKCFERHFEVV